MLKKKRLIVCDYPCKYTFPSFGFGSAEKRIWQFAKSASELKDFEVIITGHSWLPQYVPLAKYFKPRLDWTTADLFLQKFNKADYLFAGNEYFDKDKYNKAFFKVADILISYQSHPYEYDGKVAFDGKKKFLFCYSDEMMERYKKQSPFKLLLYHSGVDEVAYLTKKPKDYLIWIGRIDTDKSPHYAVLTAGKLNIPLYILGKSKYQANYKKEYKDILSSSIVKKCGVVFKKEKMKLLSEALCGIYTIGPNYAEAGAGVLGEMLCSGIPIAGMTWKGNDAVCEAVDDKRLGRVVLVNRKMDDNEIAEELTEAIKYCLTLDREKIFKLANDKYNMKKLIGKMFRIIESNRG